VVAVLKRALAIVALLAGHVHADDDGEVKLSLPTETERQAWLRPGFRLSLGFAYGELLGLRGAPSGRELGVGMHAGLRLDADWSLIASFQYARISSPNGISGLRFSGTLDPTWHVTRAFSLAIGVGFGGLINGRTNNADINPLPNTLDSSYTYGSSNPALNLCSGGGVVGVVRGQYAWVIGPRGEIYLEGQIIGNYIECVDPTGRTEPDTAQPIVRTQYWPMSGGTLSLGFTWR
jgi:hypothetical protein